MAIKVNSTFKVLGMTCEHCVNAVTKELSSISGVSKVHVDLATGDVEVTADHELEASSVQSAIEEAGYELADL